MEKIPKIILKLLEAHLSARASSSHSCCLFSITYNNWPLNV